jgi:hypothetical protein
MSLRAFEESAAISYNILSLRAKRGNLIEYIVIASDRRERGNLNLFERDCFAPLGLAMTSEGIFYASHNNDIIV